MASSVVGLFDTNEQAQFAVRQLIASGIDTHNISVVASDSGGTIRRETVDESGDLASAGAISGATSGLLVGGLIGLLVGATALAVPPVGFVVAGPIAGLITGAGIGMVSGGLLGALIGLGIPEEEAHIYAESVRRGSILVSVNVDEADRIRVEQVLAMAGAVNISERAAIYRQNGFAAYDPKLPVYTPEEVIAERNRLGIVAPAVPLDTVVTTTPTTAVPPAVPVAAVPVSTAVSNPAPGTTVVDQTFYVPDDEFMTDYQTNYASTGAAFDVYRPAYRFGYEMAGKPDFTGLDWSVIEPRARTVWESSNPGTWDRYRTAIQTGWSRAGVRTGSGGATLI